MLLHYLGNLEVQIWWKLDCALKIAFYFISFNSVKSTDFHNSFTAAATVNTFSSVKKMKSTANWKKTSSEVAYEQCSSEQGMGHSEWPVTQVTHWALDPWPMWPMTHGLPGPSPHSTSASLIQRFIDYPALYLDIVYVHTPLSCAKLLAGFIFDFEFHCKLFIKK